VRWPVYTHEHPLSLGYEPVSFSYVCTELLHHPSITMSKQQHLTYAPTQAHTHTNATPTHAWVGWALTWASANR
jgi:hypothetical protein